jgi:hypothetical protein
VTSCQKDISPTAVNVRDQQRVSWRPCSHFIGGVGLCPGGFALMLMAITVCEVG